MSSAPRELNGLEPLGDGPYGPCTPRVRRFLVQLAGLGRAARTKVVATHLVRSVSSAYRAADMTLANTVARAGREDARDALAGPLFQLVQFEHHTRAAFASELPVIGDEKDADDPLSDLDPIAEPALAAALALLVSDILPAEAFAELYAPFADVL